MLRAALALILICFSFAAARAEPPDAGLVSEFKDKIGLDEDPEGRLKLVDRVAKSDTREGATLLLDGVGSVSERLDALGKTLAGLEARHEELNTNQDVAQDDFKTRTEVRERMMDVDRRMGGHRKVLERILAALRGYASPEARSYVAKTATAVKTWRQRGYAAQAAASYAGPEGASAAVRALKDKEPRVVFMALQGLALRKDEETAVAVAACLKIEVWIVQSQAAETLAAIGSGKSVRPLIEALAKTSGRVRDDINKALQQLTGQKIAAEYEAWKAWFEEHQAEFEGPDAKPLGRARGKPAKEEGATYYGIKTPSKRIVYVLDISGSMKTPIGGAEGGTVSPAAGEEERPTGPKIDIAKNELKRAIRGLPDDAYFNIITFNHLVKHWEKGMVKATQKNKNKAYIFIRELEAAGSTYTYGALKEAFKLAGMGATDPEYDSGVDTIFLLSDGAPTDQSFPMSKLMEPELVLEAARQWNRLSKVVIHAIAIDVATQGSSFIRFMKLLADQHGGEYIERG